MKCILPWFHGVLKSWSNGGSGDFLECRKYQYNWTIRYPQPEEKKMGDCKCRFLLFSLITIAVLAFLLHGAIADNPYRYYTWRITYGDIYPLGQKQQGILINGQYPGPHIDCVTNDNLIITIYNYLDEPFLMSWNGIQQRKNSWQDGVSGTNCPILPGKNFTYMIQAKDQIGSYFYFPSLGMHKAVGGFGSIKVYSRPGIPVPYLPPAGDFVVLAGDSFKRTHKNLRYILDTGKSLPFPDGLHINGRGWNGYTFTVAPGKTYRFRITNVGIATSINVRIQDHAMKLVEVEGSHTIQNLYSSLDVHPGQSYSVLVTANRPPKDYYFVISSRFTSRVLTTTAVLHYSNSWTKVSGAVPGGPTTDIVSSLYQARSVRRDLAASAPRPNPQGSYHYGLIKPTRTVVLANSAQYINGKQRYAVNSVSYFAPDTPLKLADYFNIGGVFNLGSIPDRPSYGNGYYATSVMAADYRGFYEIVFQNNENTVQTWHMNGYSFFVVGMDGGQWNAGSRKQYNLRDAVFRCTTQVYPKSWTAIYVALDNMGMWNIRSETWERQYLGQQFYMRVYAPSNSLRDEYPIPKNALLCGRARGRHTRPL